MCGRYVLKRKDLEAILQQVDVPAPGEFHSRYNIAPSSIVPLIRRTPEGAAEAKGVRWGLIPAWSKPDTPVKPLVNVRSDTLLARFRGALRSRRCVLPASGFFEWETAGAKKRPWYFARRDGQPFGLAAIWDTWRGGDGVELETCAVVTTAANAVLRPVHDRMPVMLTPEQCQVWVRNDDSATVEKLLASAPDESIAATRVGPAVSSVRNDGPECIEPAPEEPPDRPEPQLSLGF